MTRAVEAVMGREGYAPADPARIPPRYPALAREVARVAISDESTDGLRAVLFEDWDRTFERALRLSRERPGADVVAVVHPPLQPTRIKAYRDGQVVLKLGDDPDEEVAYCPAVSSEEEARRFLERWWPGAAASPSLLQALAGVRRDCLYRDAVGGAWPLPLVERVFLSRRSRLYVES